MPRGSDAGPMRSRNDLAEMVEMILDKGVVINADIAVTIGDTELLGVKVRAAIASFETAAEYGLEFPEGVDAIDVQQRRHAEAPLAASDADAVEAGEDEDEDDGGVRTATAPRTEEAVETGVDVAAPVADPDADDATDDADADDGTEASDGADASDGEEDAPDADAGEESDADDGGDGTDGDR